MIHSTKHDRISITFLEMYANVRDIPRNIVECRLVCGTFHFHAAEWPLHFQEYKECPLHFTECLGMWGMLTVILIRLSNCVITGCSIQGCWRLVLLDKIILQLLMFLMSLVYGTTAATAKSVHLSTSHHLRSLMSSGF